MDINFVCSELNLRAQIDARLRDAGYIHRGGGSALVALIGRGATAAARAASRVATWADGSSELTASNQHRIAI